MESPILNAESIAARRSRQPKGRLVGSREQSVT
jgi:hypothetical protein